MGRDVLDSHSLGFAEGIAFARRLRRDPLRVMPEIAARYGDVARFAFGKLNVAVLSNPEHIHQVLVTDDWNYIKSRALDRARRSLGDGLLTSGGELHRRQRRLIQPAFNHERLRSYAASMVHFATSTVTNWNDGAEIDIHAEMMALTLRIVARTLFGASVDSETGEVSKNLTVMIENFNVLAGPLEEFLERFSTPKTRRFAAARGRLDAIVYRLIAECRARPEGVDSDDLMAMLAGRGTEEEARMSEELLRDEVMTIFLAGHETTANALTYCWWLLAQHPEAEARMHAEIDGVLCGRPATMEDVPKLMYTRQVFAEAMRLYPPAWLIGRTAVTATRVGGHDFPAGAILLTPQWVVHRDARWYDTPLRFDPSRWEPEEVAKRPKFSYFPFGAGTRLCVGEQFAWMEGVLVLATIAQRCRLELPQNAPRELDLVPGISLRPKSSVPMIVTATARNRPAE